MLTTRALRPPVEPPKSVPVLPIPVRKIATVASAFASQPAVTESSESQNPLRKLAFYASLGFLFLRITTLSELLLYYLHINFYLLYLFAPLAILGTITTGGLGRAFAQRASGYWLAFFVWMVLATPFSSWKGDSLALIMSYGRVQLPMLFVIGGLAMNWKEIRLIFYTMAVSAMVNLATVQLFARVDNGSRITLDASGNLGNSNDLGAHLLLVMPYILFIILDKARSAFLRIALLPVLGYGVVVVLGTGSRGCMIAIAAIFLFALWRATPGQRVATLAVGAIFAATIPFVLPGSVMDRLSTLFKEDPTNTEAAQSSAQREYLLKQSLVYTVQHPIFGVGPGQFPNYEGRMSLEEGKHGAWKVTHNFLTQISSENGIPGLLFMLLGVSSALLLVDRTYRHARKNGFIEIANACYCFTLGMVGYLGSVIFLAQAYHLYLPTMIGLAISMSTIAMRYMSSGPARNAAVLPAPWLRASS